MIRISPDLPGRITAIDQTYHQPRRRCGSRGSTSRSTTARRRKAWGRLSFDLHGTYYLRYDVQNPDGSYTGQVGTTSTASSLTPA